MTKTAIVERAVKHLYRRARVAEPEIIWLSNPQQVYERAISTSYERLPTPTLRWRWRNALIGWAVERLRRAPGRWENGGWVPGEHRHEPRAATPAERAQQNLDRMAQRVALEAVAESRMDQTISTLTEAGMTLDGNARSGVRRTERRRLEDHWTTEWDPSYPAAALLHASTVAMLPGVVYACLPPETLVIDGRGRLHNEDGPVARYADGWEMFAIEGIRVPREWVMEPESITPAQIRQQRNQELRRIMMQQYGLERFMSADGGRVLDEDVDELGLPRRLWWSRNGRAAEAVVALEVQNSSLEPDGTRRTFFLRVPPTMATVRAAAAWTFRLTEAEYKPTHQS